MKIIISSIFVSIFGFSLLCHATQSENISLTYAILKQSRTFGDIPRYIPKSQIQTDLRNFISQKHIENLKLPVVALKQNTIIYKIKEKAYTLTFTKQNQILFNNHKLSINTNDSLETIFEKFKTINYKSPVSLWMIALPESEASESINSDQRLLASLVGGIGAAIYYQTDAFKSDVAKVIYDDMKKRGLTLVDNMKCEENKTNDKNFMSKLEKFSYMQDNTTIDVKLLYDSRGAINQIQATNRKCAEDDQVKHESFLSADKGIPDFCPIDPVGLKKCQAQSENKQPNGECFSIRYFVNGQENITSIQNESTTLNPKPKSITESFPDLDLNLLQDCCHQGPCDKYINEIIAHSQGTNSQPVNTQTQGATTGK